MVRSEVKEREGREYRLCWVRQVLRRKKSAFPILVRVIFLLLRFFVIFSLLALFRVAGVFSFSLLSLLHPLGRGIWGIGIGSFVAWSFSFPV